MPKIPLFIMSLYKSVFSEIFDKTIRLSILQIIRVILIAIGLTLKTDIPVSSDMIHPFKPVISIMQIIDYRV